MSTHAATAPAALSSQSSHTGAGKALGIGIVGIVLTALGLLVPDNGHNLAIGWLVGVMFWLAISIGMLLMVMIHHIFDASWSVVIRRQFEHGIDSFKWLALLFAPLLAVTWIYPGSVWPWTDLSHPVHGGTVGTDMLYIKKSAFLNVTTLTIFSVLFFVSWWALSAALRRASFKQDSDGDAKWTIVNRRVSAFGLILTALTLTAASIYWMKSLEYHWFSTMYGVWFFSNCMRGALGVGLIMMLWLYNRGDYKGILNTNHLHSIGQLIFAFTVFWAYITFSQYFLIWGANIPEETFWYNLREVNLDGTPNQWKYVGIVLILFGHFLVPFLYLLSYKNKVVHKRIKFIVIWIMAVLLIDLIYNTYPALKDAAGNAQPFLSLNLLWAATSVIGVGGIWVWSYLHSLPTTKLIPIRDPRITECLTHHE